jgi:hypothetical protein
VRDRIEQLLASEGAPSGYAIGEIGDGQAVMVRYLTEPIGEAMTQFGGDRSTLTRHPSPKLNRCADILSDDGYHVEYVQEATAHAPRVSA